MNNKEVTLGSLFFGIIMSALILYLSITFVPKERQIHNYYQVYLGGERIGLIASKDELLELIDNEQQEIKDKYKVDKVHSPNNI